MKPAPGFTPICIARKATWATLSIGISGLQQPTATYSLEQEWSQSPPPCWSNNLMNRTLIIVAAIGVASFAVAGQTPAREQSFALATPPGCVCMALASAATDQGQSWCTTGEQGKFRW